MFQNHPHYNLFIGGDNDIGGIVILYGPKNVRIQNNTLDGLNGVNISAAVFQSDGDVTFRSNLLVNVPRPSPVIIRGGMMMADYNLFWHSATPAYSDGRLPTHDASSDPQLTSPPSASMTFDETAVWKRTLSVRDVLASYRARYAPKVRSPVIGGGDPAGGTGNYIGAVGSGMTSLADEFGK